MIIWRIRDLATRVLEARRESATGPPLPQEANSQVDGLLSAWPSGIIRLLNQIKSGRGRCAHLVRRPLRVMSFRVKPEAPGEEKRPWVKWPLICVAFLLLGLAIGLYRTPPAGSSETPKIGNTVAADLVTGASTQNPDTQAQSSDAQASSEQSEGDGETPAYPSPRVKLTTYTVQPGDTLTAIAAKFNTSTASIAYINGLTSPDRISVGMDLSVIENASGIVVKVSQGDTLWDISRRYGVSIPEIAQANNLDVSEVLKVGTTLILPGAPLRSVPSVSRSSSFRWPIQGSLTSTYGWRTHPISGQETFHDGLDIAASTGTPIGAAAGGTVKFAGWSGGYGRFVVIDHGDGLETRYGHMSSIGVSTGQVVSAGEIIGYVGQSGDATGPHVHFEIRKNGKTLDPRDYLP